MSKPHRIIRILLAVLLAAFAVVLLGLSLFTGPSRKDPRGVADDLGRRVEVRLRMLDGYVEQALEGDYGNWMLLDGLPSDMVVYRYVDDSLQSWANQFPLRSDDIHPRTLVQRLGESRSDVVSPLREAEEQLRFVNHGPKWYLEKAVTRDRCKVIAGLEMVNELQAGSLNGVNRFLRTDDRFRLAPLSASVGTVVRVDGVPLFKLTSEDISEPIAGHAARQLLAVILLLMAMLLVLSVYSRPSWLGANMAVQAGLLTWIYYYGRHLGTSTQVFSPLIYADGPVLYSLGAVIIINLAITLAVMDFFLMRRVLLKKLLRRNSATEQAVLAGVILVSAGAILFYLHYSFRSILINADICLELYKVGLLNIFTAIVYTSYLALALSLPPLLQMAFPLLRRFTGWRPDLFATPMRALISVAIGLYFVTVSSVLGFRKEQRRIDVWANRLAMDRDISLEIQLRMAENAIATDPMVGALALLDGGSDLIRSRLVSMYMGRISQDYDISVTQAGEGIASHPLFQERIRSGVRLSDNSHFFYSQIGSGRTCYTGLFTYIVEGYGALPLLVSVESKHNREDRGYMSLLGISEPGRVSLPPVYSRAKYIDTHLIQYKGTYPYPTLYSGRMARLAESHPDGHIDMDGYCHFIHNVSEGEIIILSRKSTDALDYIVCGFLLAILAFLVLSALSLRGRRRSGSHYFQTRISLTLYISLFLTLVAMAGFSVWFVYKRNAADMQGVMTARINTLQSMLQERLRQVEGKQQLRSPETRAAMEGIGNNLKCDITLFDADGLVAFSTTPEVYDRMILGLRANARAYYQIIYGHKRFHMQRERVGRRRFYALYAPVFNSNGRMIAIASSPYTELTQDFETEAITHIASVLTIFLLLLLIARVLTYEVISRMFRPLTEMSRKMTVTDVDHLEPIAYEQEDEITPLVTAYNRMVLSLGDSSRRLAQAERDKAWTDMARRVAHDLKNPLTPIKLQLQMLIRMKAAGNPAWQDRFDEVASTVLYHVDLLADSADQFSTFAKMYDQKNERIDLDTLVRQEVDLFDSREDIRMDYFGLEGAVVTGPRPQLTRVVVNLITNAIQAVEEVPGEKRILASLRNASEDGWFEIVVEDNGAGVSEQNQDKIFTPDFTTKTSGSGLGLAICKRIVEHCGGSISYNRSFGLGGACFTVRLPKENLQKK